MTGRLVDLAHHFLSRKRQLVAEVAALAGRRHAAQALLTLLAPYQDRLAVVQSAPLGAMAHYLGLLATTVQDWDQARYYLDRAAEIHQRVGAHRWYNRTRLAQAACCSPDGTRTIRP